MVYQRRPRLCVVFLLVETWDAWWNAPCSTPAMVCHSIEGSQARDQLMCQRFNPVRSGRCHGLPKGSKWTNRVEFHVQPPLCLFHSKVWSGMKWKNMLKKSTIHRDSPYLISAGWSIMVVEVLQAWIQCKTQWILHNATVNSLGKKVKTF